MTSTNTGTRTLKIACFRLLAVLLVLACVEAAARGAEALFPAQQASIASPNPGADPASLRRLAAMQRKAGQGVPMQEDQARQWALTPGVRLVNRFGITFRVNALGMRGPRVQPRAPGEQRLLALGDSSVFGVNVPERKVFINMAAAAMSQQPGQRVTAVNGAAPGHDSSQAYETLRLHGKRVQPTWVVIACLWSDVIYQRGPDMRFTAGQEGAFTLRRALGRVALYRLLKRGLAPWLQSRRVSWAASDAQIGAAADGSQSRVSLSSYIANLRRMVRLARSLGARPAFVVLPAPADFDQAPVVETVQVYRQAMRLVARQEGAPLVDGPKLFRARGADVGWFLDHVHPGPRGHALLGQALADLLSRAGPVGAAQRTPEDDR